MGWLKHKSGEEVRGHLEELVPHSQAAGAQIAFRFLSWLRLERKCSPKTELLLLNTFKRLAKYLYRDQASKRWAPQADKFSQLEVLQEFWGFEKELSRRAKCAKPASDISKKWLDWPFFLKAVERLRAECRSLTSRGKRRSKFAIAQSWQRSVLCQIMASTADRQRTFRELEFGRTLVKVPLSDFGEAFSEESKEDGDVKPQELWAIKHTSEDYKTGSVYGERPLLPLGPRLSKDIDEFVSTWRPHLCRGGHQFLFSRKDGGPLKERDIWCHFTQAMQRVAGKRCNPHLLRDMIVTHVRGSNVSFNQLESLALYMGHSLKQQASTYDKRSKEEKISPAVKLLNSISGSAQS
eukprot:Skav217294  [mRNA]  locus=scaffold1466:146528:147580:+ [translate_table: standard]